MLDCHSSVIHCRCNRSLPIARSSGHLLAELHPLDRGPESISGSGEGRSVSKRLAGPHAELEFGGADIFCGFPWRPYHSGVAGPSREASTDPLGRGTDTGAVLHAHLYVYAYAHTCLCLCLCMHVCMCVRVHTTDPRPLGVANMVTDYRHSVRDTGGHHAHRRKRHEARRARGPGAELVQRHDRFGGAVVRK